VNDPTANIEAAYRQASGIDAPGAYGNLLRVARSLNRATVAARTPALLATEAFVEDEGTKKNILTLLNVLQATTAAPVIGAHGRAGMQTMQQASNPRAASRVVGQQMGQEAMLQSAPLVEALLQHLTT